MRPRRSRALPAPLQCSPMTQKITPGTAVLLVIPPLLWAGNAVVGRLVVDLVHLSWRTARKQPYDNIKGDLLIYALHPRLGDAAGTGTR